MRRAAGAHYPLAVGAEGLGVGTRYQPHSAPSCKLALRAVGAARGRPAKAPLACVWGVWNRALSHPRPPVLWGVRPGPAICWLWGRGKRAWGPVTNPPPRALASWLCALWGRHEAVFWNQTNQASRAIAAEEKKNQEKNAQPEKIKRKVNFSDLRNPPKNFTPLFGEVPKFRTLTEKEEQHSRDGDDVERCLPQNT